MDSKLKKDILTKNKKDKIVVLTGAGISAESGIPTSRDPEGYWNVGAQEYHPQEMPILSMFERNPREIWTWYLYRKTVCNRAFPNKTHEALINLEKGLKENFLLITQNVDGLHLQSGQSEERAFQIHGDINYTRCSENCGIGLMEVPKGIGEKNKEDKITDKEWESLKCPNCSELIRPHVFMF